MFNRQTPYSLARRRNIGSPSSRHHPASPGSSQTRTPDLRTHPPSCLTHIQRYPFPTDLGRLEENECCGDRDRRDHYLRRHAVGIVLLNDLPAHHSILRQVLQRSRQMSDHKDKYDIKGAKSRLCTILIPINTAYLPPRPGSSSPDLRIPTPNTSSHRFTSQSSPNSPMAST